MTRPWPSGRRSRLHYLPGICCWRLILNLCYRCMPSVCWPCLLGWQAGHPVASSCWRIPSRALPYWRPDAKYLSPLPSSMPCGLRNSVTLGHPQSFSAKWFLDDRRVSSSQVVDVVRQRWHDGGLPQDSTGPGARRTSARRTWPFQRLASNRTDSFVVCLVYEIRRIFRRHHVSKASSRFEQTGVNLILVEWLVKTKSIYLSSEMLQSMTVDLLVLTTINGRRMVEPGSGVPQSRSVLRFRSTRFLNAICCAENMQIMASNKCKSDRQSGAQLIIAQITTKHISKTRQRLDKHDWVY